MVNFVHKVSSLKQPITSVSDDIFSQPEDSLTATPPGVALAFLGPFALTMDVPKPKDMVPIEPKPLAEVPRMSESRNMDFLPNPKIPLKNPISDGFQQTITKLIKLDDVGSILQMFKKNQTIRI